MENPIVFDLDIERLYGIPKRIDIPKAASGMLVSAPTSVPAIVREAPTSTTTDVLTSNTSQTLMRDALIYVAVVGIGLAAVYCYKQHQIKKQADRKNQPLGNHATTVSTPFHRQF